LVDVTKLPNEELARHLGNPESDTGIAVAEYMNRVNRTLSEAAYRRLEPADTAHVLEIGFGNGRLVPLLFGLADGIRYTGVDISGTMVDEAISANPALIDAGRAAFHRASVEALPFAEATFDRAVGVNTLYFWPDPRLGLAELRRVLKPEGLLLLACASPETAATSTTMKPELGFAIYDEAAILDLHSAAGFSDTTIEPYEEIGRRLDGTPYPRRYLFSIARP
jgi:SAM-dependent methyltransferase